MKKRDHAVKKPVASKDALLALVLLSSLILFFVCLRLIPGRPVASEHALLRATAILLALCIPAFFYLHTAEESAEAVLGSSVRVAVPWRHLAFFVGAFCFGIFLNRLSLLGSGAEITLFSLFRFYRTFSFPSFVALLTFSFATTFLPYGVLFSRVSRLPRLFAVFAMAALYAALGLSLWGMLALFLFGAALALLRLHSFSLLPVFLCNFSFLFGAYADKTSLVSFLMLNKLPAWGCLLILGFLTAAFLFLSLKRRHATKGIRMDTSEDKTVQYIWIGVSFLLLVVSASLCLIGGK